MFLSKLLFKDLGTAKLVFLIVFIYHIFFFIELIGTFLNKVKNAGHLIIFNEMVNSLLITEVIAPWEEATYLKLGLV